jgi:multimeric flavodoxin WrbA
MPFQRNIVAISGTSRPDNYTSLALAVTVEALRKAGAEVQLFDARNQLRNQRAQ